MAARTTRGVGSLPDSWKERIKAASIVGKLQDHIDGTADMSQTQIAAAKILLGKVAPDLNKTDVQALDGDGEPTDANWTVKLVDARTKHD